MFSANKKMLFVLSLAPQFTLYKRNRGVRVKAPTFTDFRLTKIRLVFSSISSQLERSAAMDVLKAYKVKIFWLKMVARLFLDYNCCVLGLSYNDKDNIRCVLLFELLLNDASIFLAMCFAKQRPTMAA